MPQTRRSLSVILRAVICFAAGRPPAYGTARDNTANRPSVNTLRRLDLGFLAWPHPLPVMRQPDAAPHFCTEAWPASRFVVRQHGLRGCGDCVNCVLVTMFEWIF